MGRPRLDRSGDVEAEERNVDPASAEAKDVEPNSPKPATESPTKQVVFRSKDKGLRLEFKAPYVDKSHGIASYVPGLYAKFEDGFLRFDDTPKNAKAIALVRGHSRNGKVFKEVTDIVNAEILPAIGELEKMAIEDLMELANKRQLVIEKKASKESVILSLLKAVIR